MSSRQNASSTDYSNPPRSERAANAERVSPRVLAVDDDPGMRLLLQETLSQAGFSVRIAESGAEAIEVCLDFGPDLILLDINMPCIDGISACAEIRKRDQRNFPIIMVTSVDDTLSIQKAFDAGANDFILKPVNWPIFQRRLEMLADEWIRSKQIDECNQRVRLLERVVPEQVLMVSRNGRIIEDLKTRPGPSLARIGSPGATLEDLFGSDTAGRFKQRISCVLKSRQHANLKFQITEQGLRRDCEAQFLVDGRERVVIVIQDDSATIKTKDTIYDLAFHDPDTNLPNRNLFERRADEVLAIAGLNGRSVDLVSMCFDNFANDYLDRRSVKCAIAIRLTDSLKDCNGLVRLGDGDHVSRIGMLGANRFMFMLENVKSNGDLRAVCDQIAKCFEDPVIAGDESIAVSPRFGVAAFPEDGRNLHTLTDTAHAAMLEALETGNRVCSGSLAANVRDIGSLDFASELRQAINDNQLELYFQPRVSLPDGNVTCIEALLRWNHPLRGFVGLRELLHLAQATGLMVPLGDWVLRKASEEARGWQCVRSPRVSINLSQQEFARQDLADRVAEILGETGLDPTYVEFELTEASLLRTRNGLADLNRLKDLGVGLVLDDFGTGFSSLAALKTFPIDVLKIDASFVNALPSSDKDAVICEVIITMASKLGMKAVAEGVETEEQLRILQGMGCHEFQGFHICKPMPADEVKEFLRRNPPRI